MTAARHFALSFFGPIVAGALFCGLVSLFSSFLEFYHVPVLILMLVGFIVVALFTRWFVRKHVAVVCPFCGGKSYEIPDRGNRFVCTVCAKDH
ncbi:MAG: zinc ribbon domain-containing protein [Prosthecobacter sp.]